eukprot:contig_13517_g3242
MARLCNVVGTAVPTGYTVNREIGCFLSNAGFDPLYLSNYLDQDYAAQGELKNGRVAMLACLGWLVAEVVHLPNKQFSNPVALDAIYQVPVAGWVQILIAISVVELATFKMVYDPKRAAGQLGFDPLKMDSPTMRLKEVKNGRLAMIGISTWPHLPAAGLPQAHHCAVGQRRDPLSFPHPPIPSTRLAGWVA